MLAWSSYPSSQSTARLLACERTSSWPSRNWTSPVEATVTTAPAVSVAVPLPLSCWSSRQTGRLGCLPFGRWKVVPFTWPSSTLYFSNDSQTECSSSTIELFCSLSTLNRAWFQVKASTFPYHQRIELSELLAIGSPWLVIGLNCSSRYLLTLPPML